MIIDADKLVLGRLASTVAKRALEGEKIDIVNSEKAVIVGRKGDILKKYKHRRERGDPLHGPYFPRQAERIVKRAIRNMVGYKKPKGKEALARIKCYKGVPNAFKDKDKETIENAKLSKKIIKFLTIKELSEFLGGK